VAKKSVRNWSDVTDKEIQAFVEKVYALRDKMLPDDCDGDPVIQIEFIDRRKERSGYFRALPYDHKDWEGYKRAVFSNAANAMKEVEQFFRLEEFHEKEEGKERKS
jgi:hypothetical protein